MTRPSPLSAGRSGWKRGTARTQTPSDCGSASCSPSWKSTSPPHPRGNLRHVRAGKPSTCEGLGRRPSTGRACESWIGGRESTVRVASSVVSTDQQRTRTE